MDQRKQTIIIIDKKEHPIQGRNKSFWKSFLFNRTLCQECKKKIIRKHLHKKCKSIFTECDSLTSGHKIT